TTRPGCFLIQATTRQWRMPSILMATAKLHNAFANACCMSLAGGAHDLLLSFPVLDKKSMNHKTQRMRARRDDCPRMSLRLCVSVVSFLLVSTSNGFAQSASVDREALILYDAPPCARYLSFCDLLHETLGPPWSARRWFVSKTVDRRRSD